MKKKFKTVSGKQIDKEELISRLMKQGYDFSKYDLVPGFFDPPENYSVGKFSPKADIGDVWYDLSTDEVFILTDVINKSQTWSKLPRTDLRCVRLALDLDNASSFAEVVGKLVPRVIGHNAPIVRPSKPKVSLTEAMRRVEDFLSEG